MSGRDGAVDVDVDLDAIDRPDGWWLVLFEPGAPWPFGTYPDVEREGGFWRCAHPDGGADVVPDRYVAWAVAPADD